jgi:site-specific recombinase XerD
VVLFLTRLVQAGGSGPHVRRHLYLLGVARQLKGEPSPAADPEVKRYLRGLHRTLPSRSLNSQADPLYVEDLLAILDAMCHDNTRQLRDVALLLIANATSASVGEMLRLDWSDVAFRRQALDLTLLRRQGNRRLGAETVHVSARRDDLCPVTALRDWRRRYGSAAGPVWKRTSQEVGRMQEDEIYEVLRRVTPRRRRQAPPVIDDEALHTQRRELSREAAVLVRDRALLLLMFAAGLTWREVRDLRIGDVVISQAGLLLSCGRREPVGIPRGRRRETCPVTAWESWRDLLIQDRQADTSHCAFPATRGYTIQTRPMGVAAIDGVIHRRAEAALLTGRFATTSPWQGAVRSAARADADLLTISQQCGRLSIASIAKHVDKEHRLARSVVSRLGL